jgi:hypothetical protein
LLWHGGNKDLVRKEKADKGSEESCEERDEEGIKEKTRKEKEVRCEKEIIKEII